MSVSETSDDGNEDGSLGNSEEAGLSDSQISHEEESEEEILEPKILPERATRGGRMSQLLDEQESADEEFWNQEFFAEEEKDREFEASESEEEDVPDTDFSESEDDDEDSDDAIEAQTRREERKGKKVLKPPGGVGGRKPAAVKVAGHSKSEAKAITHEPPLSPNTRAAIKAAKEADAAEFIAPTLRKSTMRRTEEAKKERQEAEMAVRPKKRRKEQVQRLLTQDELLAEAAQTEILNLRSLEALQAAEEEVRKRAAVKRVGYSGPCLRLRSKQINGESLISCEVANMLMPPEMRKQKAPVPRQPTLCFITGQMAKYRDPLTGYPYANAQAFQQLRQNAQHMRRYKPRPASGHSAGPQKREGPRRTIHQDYDPDY